MHLWFGGMSNTVRKYLFLPLFSPLNFYIINKLYFLWWWRVFKTLFILKVFIKCAHNREQTFSCKKWPHHKIAEFFFSGGWKEYSHFSKNFTKVSKFPLVFICLHNSYSIKKLSAKIKIVFQTRHIYLHLYKLHFHLKQTQEF